MSRTGRRVHRRGFGCPRSNWRRSRILPGMAGHAGSRPTDPQGDHPTVPRCCSSWCGSPGVRVVGTCSSSTRTARSGNSILSRTCSRPWAAGASFSTGRTESSGRIRFRSLCSDFSQVPASSTHWQLFFSHLRGLADSVFTVRLRRSSMVVIRRSRKYGVNFSKSWTGSRHPQKLHDKPQTLPSGCGAKLLQRPEP